MTYHAKLSGTRILHQVTHNRNKWPTSHPVSPKTSSSFPVQGARKGKAGYNTIQTVNRKGKAGYNTIQTVNRKAKAGYNTIQTVNRKAKAGYNIVQSVNGKRKAGYNIIQTVNRKGKAGLNGLKAVNRKVSCLFGKHKLFNKSGLGCIIVY